MIAAHADARPRGDPRADAPDARLARVAARFRGSDRVPRAQDRAHREERLRDRLGVRAPWTSIPRATRSSCATLAISQGRRLVANLKREGDSPCHTFRPGWHDPFNGSNSVIDGGACSDALAHLVRALGPSLAADERERFAAASLLHARTYLRYAVLDKGIPAQRAWGLTGLAGAWFARARSSPGTGRDRGRRRPRGDPARRRELPLPSDRMGRRARRRERRVGLLPVASHGIPDPRAAPPRPRSRGPDLPRTPRARARFPRGLAGAGRDEVRSRRGEALVLGRSVRGSRRIPSTCTRSLAAGGSSVAPADGTPFIAEDPSS